MDNPAGRVPSVTFPDSDPAVPESAGAADAVEEKKKPALPFWLELPLLILAALVIAVVIKIPLIAVRGASAGGFIVFALLLLLERVSDYRGATFGRFLLLYGLSRFAVDFSRYYEPEQIMMLGWNNNQWISVGMMLGGLAIMIIFARRRRDREPGRA